MEIPSLYYDNCHLHLPPTITGNMLNNLLNKRLMGAFAFMETPFKSLQQDAVVAESKIVISDIPGWNSGAIFNPGEPISLEPDVNYFENGEYMMVIELPFLMHPKNVILEFRQRVHQINTKLCCVLEPWDISCDTQKFNLIDATLEQRSDSISDTSLTHSFVKPNAQSEMCRFLIVRIFADSIKNHLSAISIKRYVYQYQ